MAIGQSAQGQGQGTDLSTGSFGVDKPTPTRTTRTDNQISLLTCPDRRTFSSAIMKDTLISPELEEALAEKRKLVFHATVLDQDKQPISTGEAIVEGDPTRGTFWPNYADHLDTLPPRAMTLYGSDGRVISLRDFRRCPAHSLTVHFHFRT